MSQETKAKKTITVNGQEMTMAEIKKEIIAQLPKVTKDAEFIALVQAVIKVQEASARKVGGKNQIFRELILEKRTLTEDEIWSLLKWGKHEVLSAAWYFRKKGNPEDFIYIAFQRDADGTGRYTIVGEGPEAPEGFVKKAKAKDEDDEFFGEDEA